MAHIVSQGEVKQYMDYALGITLPEFIVQAAMDKFETVETALDDAGYSDADKTLMAAMAITIIACAGAPRRIQSQGAPSGASRSFKNIDNALSALRRSLLGLDTAGVLTDLIGPDPAMATVFMVV